MSYELDAEIIYDMNICMSRERANPKSSKRHYDSGHPSYYHFKKA